MNSTIISSNVVTTLEFDVEYVVLKTYSICLLLMNLMNDILVGTVKASSWCESYVTLYFSNKLVSDKFFPMVLSLSYHN